MPTKKEKRYGRLNAVCDRYGIARGTIYNWFKAGLLKKYNPSPRVTMISIDELEALIQNGANEAIGGAI